MIERRDKGTFKKGTFAVSIKKKKKIKNSPKTANNIEYNIMGPIDYIPLYFLVNPFYVNLS